MGVAGGGRHCLGWRPLVLRKRLNFGKLECSTNVSDIFSRFFFFSRHNYARDMTALFGAFTRTEELVFLDSDNVRYSRSSCNSKQRDSFDGFFYPTCAVCFQENLRRRWIELTLLCQSKCALFFGAEELYSFVQIALKFVIMLIKVLV